MKGYSLRGIALFPLLMAATLLVSCKGDVPSLEEILAGKEVNPEPNIPLECYTDTGVVTAGKAIANPCYVCHTRANTPYVGELEDTGLTLSYSFPEEILRIGNPWLNAVRPDLTIGDVPPPSSAQIESWIRSDNWLKAYRNRGKGSLEYFPDVPPIYAYAGGTYSQINIDAEGFILDPDTGERTGWRAFRWKPFPGFFPTNGRIDSTFIRLPEKFRRSAGAVNWDVYRKNLAIVECAVKGVAPGRVCEGTEVGDITVPSRYEGDASDVPVVTYQYPPGTEFAHPVYYLDPANTISFKSLRLREMRYMKKVAYADPRPPGGGEEAEGGEFFWDNGLVVNASGFWIMIGFIEDRNGDLRPQSAEEMRFCVGCHGGVGGTVDSTYTYWRKLPGTAGWMDQDYNLTDPAIRDYSYAKVTCQNTDTLNVGPTLRRALQSYCASNSTPPGEYAVYFALTGGGDHFRSNREILSRISTDTDKISLSLSPSANILTDPSLINYLNPDGTVKPDLFLPSAGRAESINRQYYRVVQAQAFVYGRDLFGGPFGISSGGNSLERLEGVTSTGVLESGIWASFNTLLFLR